MQTLSSLAAALGLSLLLGLAPPLSAASPATTAAPAFPGAQGWAAHTPGGRGGKIVRVTTLAAEGLAGSRVRLPVISPNMPYRTEKPMWFSDQTTWVWWPSTL